MIMAVVGGAYDRRRGLEKLSYKATPDQVSRLANDARPT